MSVLRQLFLHVQGQIKLPAMIHSDLVPHSMVGNCFPVVEKCVNYMVKYVDSIGSDLTFNCM